MPVVGLEPTTLAGRDFESRAYANSATPANIHYNKLSHLLAGRSAIPRPQRFA